MSYLKPLTEKAKKHMNKIDNKTKSETLRWFIAGVIFGALIAANIILIKMFGSITIEG